MNKTQKQKTITRSQLSKIRMASGGENKISRVILDGVVMTWVGIGWIDEGAPTARQRATLPVVVD